MQELPNYRVKPGIDPNSLIPNDEPRRLTLDEISELLDNLNDVLAATEEVKQLSLQQQRFQLGTELLSVKISPSMILQLGERISQKYRQAAVKPGYAAGIAYNSSFTQRYMQAALDVKRRTGQRRSGSSEIRETLHLPKIRKNEKIFIHFKNWVDANFVYKFRSILEQVSIKKVTSRVTIDRADAFDLRWWHPLALAQNNLEYRADQIIMRLEFKVTSLVKYDITLTDIDYALSSASPTTLVLIYGNISDGIMDLYPLENVTQEEMGISNELSYRNFLQRKINPLLSTTIVSGVADVDYLVPETIPLISTFLTSHPFSEDTYRYYQKHGSLIGRSIQNFNTLEWNYWMISKNVSLFVFEGIRDDFVAYLLGICGIYVALLSDGSSAVFEDHMIVQVPAKIAESPYSVVANFKTKIREAQENINSESASFLSTLLQTEQRDPSFASLLEQRENEYTMYSTYTYAVAEKHRDTVDDEDSDDQKKTNKQGKSYIKGEINKLRKILNLEEVDPRRTYSNNFFVLTLMNGMNVARAYHIYNITQIMMASGKKSDPRHAQTFSDSSFFTGYPLGIGTRGISEHSSAFYSRAGTRQVGKEMQSAALFDTRGESAGRIITGTPELGSQYSGYVDFEATSPYDIDLDATVWDDTDEALGYVSPESMKPSSGIYVKGKSEEARKQLGLEQEGIPDVTIKTKDMIEAEIRRQALVRAKRQLRKPVRAKSKLAKEQKMPQASAKEVSLQLIPAMTDAAESIVTISEISELSIASLNTALPPFLQDALGGYVGTAPSVLEDILVLDPIPPLRMQDVEVSLNVPQFLLQFYNLQS